MKTWRKANRNRNKVDRYSRHHLDPKGKEKKPDETLILAWERHHVAWHQLFGNRNIFQIIAILQRITQLKGLKNGS